MILRKFTLNNALDTLQSAIDLYGESIRLYPRFKGTYAVGIRRLLGDVSTWIELVSRD